jgi:hypothetical protein
MSPFLKLTRQAQPVLNFEAVGKENGGAKVEGKSKKTRKTERPEKVLEMRMALEYHQK